MDQNEIINSRLSRNNLRKFALEEEDSRSYPIGGNRREASNEVKELLNNYERQSVDQHPEFRESNYEMRTQNTLSNEYPEDIYNIEPEKNESAIPPRPPKKPLLGGETVSYTHLTLPTNREV